MGCSTGKGGGDYLHSKIQIMQVMRMILKVLLVMFSS